MDDYDLTSALAIANVPESAIAGEPLAQFTGENDGVDWRWLLPMKDGLYGFLKGGCDYTGWDCQADATMEYASTPERAAALETDEAVRNDLLQQLATGRNETPRERIAQDLGLTQR